MSDNILMILGMFVGLPYSYFSVLGNPFAAGFLSIIPAFGAVCLFFGVIIGLVQKNMLLFAFVILPLLSQGLVTVSFSMIGEGPESAFWIWLFLGSQLLASIYLVYRLRSTIIAALLLAVFSLSYAYFAAFLSSMAFSDTWL